MNRTRTTLRMLPLVVVAAACAGEPPSPAAGDARVYPAADAEQPGQDTPPADPGPTGESSLIPVKPEGITCQEEAAAKGVTPNEWCASLWGDASKCRQDGRCTGASSAASEGGGRIDEPPEPAWHERAPGTN